MQEIIENLKTKLDLSSDEKLATFLGITRNTITKAKRGETSQGVQRSLKLISLLIDEMSDKQLKKALNKFKRVDY